MAANMAADNGTNEGFQPRSYKNRQKKSAKIDQKSDFVASFGSETGGIVSHLVDTNYLQSLHTKLHQKETLMLEITLKTIENGTNGPKFGQVAHFDPKFREQINFSAMFDVV